MAILEALASGRLEGATDAEVLQEILHRYTVLNERGRAIEVVNLFLRVLPSVLPVESEDIREALRIHGRYPSLQTRDSLHTAVMVRHGLETIYSADRHFDGVAEVRRRDPSSWEI